MSSPMIHRNISVMVLPNPHCPVAVCVRAAESSPFALYSFYNLVQGHGPWDYKQDATLNDFGTLNPRPNPSSPYEDFDNFNYGATGAALGLPPEALLIGAGWQATRSHSETAGTTWQNLFDLAGADDFNDQIMIMQGLRVLPAWVSPMKIKDRLVLFLMLAFLVGCSERRRRSGYDYSRFGEKLTVMLSAIPFAFLPSATVTF